MEENNKRKFMSFNLVARFLLNERTMESFYLIHKMIEHGFIEPNFQIKRNPYFVHYNSKEEIKQDIFTDDIIKNIEELSKNDWELHKKLIEDGVNPNEIAKIIRNDDIENLQKISSQTKFDINQTIEPSLYERCSFINQINVTLIDYAAFFGSVKCFKYLLMNGAKGNHTGKYAIASGNEEIIHLCEQNHTSFKGSYKAAIMFHRNNIFNYLYENRMEPSISLGKLGKTCILYDNYELFSFLLKESININDVIINKSAEIGNLYLVKYFLQNNQIPNNVLYVSLSSENIELVKYILEKEEIDINAEYIYLNNIEIQSNIWKMFKIFKTALMIASENGYTEIVQLLLEQKGIDINAKGIYLFYIGFILLISCLKIKFGNYLKYFIQHLCLHLKMVIQK